MRTGSGTRGHPYTSGLDTHAGDYVDLHTRTPSHNYAYSTAHTNSDPTAYDRPYTRAYADCYTGIDANAGSHANPHANTGSFTNPDIDTVAG